MNYWLIKSEPNVYSIDDLARDKVTHWDGIRNYQARNYLRDSMKLGDNIIFYHSNTEPIGAVGVAKVAHEGYPDYTAWDPKDAHFDPKTKKDSPTWIMIDVEFIEKFRRTVTLEEMKNNPDLQGLMVIQRGARLSVQPVSKAHFDILCTLGNSHQ